MGQLKVVHDHQIKWVRVFGAAMEVSSTIVELLNSMSTVMPDPLRMMSTKSFAFTLIKSIEQIHTVYLKDLNFINSTKSNQNSNLKMYSEGVCSHLIITRNLCPN
jgi:uncharacterized Fe-S radical SAM superfamily protein PflX